MSETQAEVIKASKTPMRLNTKEGEKKSKESFS